MSILGVLGDLVLALSADTKKFESALGKADYLAKKFGKEVGKPFKDLANQIAALAGAGSIGMLIKSQIDAADAAGKMAQKIGVSVEAFSALKYAADISNVSTDQLSTGLKQLSKNMLDTQAGTGEAKEAFRALGISVTDATGNLKSTKDQFIEIAERFARMEDGAGKTALAMRIFGKSGAELIPMLNEGRAGIEALMKEAERLGVVFSEEDAKAADEFNDNLTRLSTSVKGIAIDIAGPLVEALNKAATAFQDAKKQGETFWSSLVEGFRTLVTGTDLDKWNREFVQATNDLLDAQNRLDRMKSQPKWLDPFGLGLRKATEDVKKFQAEVDRLRAIKPIMFPEIPKPPELPKDAAPALPESAADRAARLREEARKLAEQLRKDAEAAREAEEAFKRWSAAVVAAFNDEIAWIEAGKEIERIAQQQRDLQTSIDEMIEKARTNPRQTDEEFGPAGVGVEQAEKLKELRLSLMTEEEEELRAHQERLREIRYEFTDDELEAMGGRNAVLEELEQQHQARLYSIRRRGLTTLNAFTKASWQQQAATVFGELAAITAGVAQHNKALFNINKVAAIANAIINAHQGATRTLATYPWPIAGALAAIHYAAGLAQVMAIKNTSFGGGGAGIAPSVVGTTPAPPVTAIEPTTAATTPVTQAAAAPREVTVNVTSSRSRYTREEIMEFFDAANEALGEGANLRVTFQQR